MEWVVGVGRGGEGRHSVGGRMRALLVGWGRKEYEYIYRKILKKVLFGKEFSLILFFHPDFSEYIDLLNFC
jgi:hypothetical protein